MVEDRKIEETYMEDLINNYDIFLLDLDGVLTTPKGQIGEAFKILDYLLSIGREYYIYTNIGFLSRESLAEIIKSEHGVSIPVFRIIVTSYIAGRYIREYYPDTNRVYVLGNETLAEEIRKAGFKTIGGTQHDLKELPNIEYNKFEYECDVVVVCKDVNFNAYKLYCASFAIQRGAKFLGISVDPYYKIGANQVPDTGAYLNYLTAATGVQPTIIGKPHPFGFMLAKQKMQKYIYKKGEEAKVIMLGDTLYTDILGAQEAGFDTCLVLTGNTTREQVMSAHNTIIPHYIMPQFDHWREKPF